MTEGSESSVQLFSYDEDQPNEQRGALIPRSLAVDEIVAEEVAPGEFLIGVRRVARVTLVPVAGFAMLAFAVFSGYSAATTDTTQIAAPVVTILDPHSASRTTLAYGPEAALSSATLFTDTHDAFVESGQTFISIDLEQSLVRFFENGVLLINEPILASGEMGSWWDTPSGIYKIESKDEEKFSSYTQTYFPWNLTFEGNYVIHGWPQYPNGEAVNSDFVGGGVRIDDAGAEQLFAAAEPGTPVIVREKSIEVADSFVYQPQVSDISARHYLVADIENGTVLASSDLNRSVPIASLTKLMTAVVAAEKMNLDDRVYVASPSFVQSLVPRLQERTSVSMYSLLQLLLVESSNESAEVIAGEYGRADFIDEMNAKAKVLGMFNTTFDDPSGLSSNNISSLQDLFQLTRYIYTKRDFILEITESGEAVGVEGGGEFANLSNFNEVETRDDFVGGKIGETEAAGMTSITLHDIAVQNTQRTVAVILLNSGARNDDVATLLALVEARFNE